MRVSVEGDLRRGLEAELARMAAGLRRAVERAGREVQAELRGQVERAGFRDGRAIAAAWRLRVYPEAPSGTLRPSALVYPRAPNVVDAFERGVEISAKGGRYLAWPTGFNATGGRRRAGMRGGVRVTPAEMTSRGAFLVPFASGGGFLWCLRVRRGERQARRSRTRVFAGDLEVATGGRAGREAWVSGLLERGFVPMYFLARVVRPRKRLDVAGVAARAGAVLERATRAEFGGAA